MNLAEYNQIQHLDYNAYCDYLQKKYGLSKEPYYKNRPDGWVKNHKITRTKDGLVIHHKMEDRMIWLSKKEIAELCPHDYQIPNNLVYCDYLEHLLLHILICETTSHPEPDCVSSDKEFIQLIKGLSETPGIDGIRTFIIPELNDYYSGWRPKQQWKKNVLCKVENDIDVFFYLVKRFKLTCEDQVFIMCLKSFNAQYGTWSNENNKELYQHMWAL